MDAPSRPNLLAAALAFARQSTAIAIVPLAAATLATPAEATPVPLDLDPFGNVYGELTNPNAESGSTNYYSGSSHTPAAISGDFQIESLGTVNGVNGARFKVDDFTFMSDAGGPTPLTGIFYFNSMTNGGTLNAGAVLSSTYNFTINTSGGISNLTWRLAGTIFDFDYSFSSENLGSISDTIASGGTPVSYNATLGSFTVPTQSAGGMFSLQFEVSFQAATNADYVQFAMSDPGQGLTFSAAPAAVPEPSTYALLAGFGALAGVMLRRRARAA